MTLEQTKVVDFVGVEKATGVFVLTLTDAWGWTDEEEHQHLLLLEEKINSYLATIESGEVYREYAARTGQPVPPPTRTRVSIRALHPPSPKGSKFLRHVQDVFGELCIEFEHVVGRSEHEISLGA